MSKPETSWIRRLLGPQCPPSRSMLSFHVMYPTLCALLIIVKMSVSYLLEHCHFCQSWRNITRYSTEHFHFLYTTLIVTSVVCLNLSTTVLLLFDLDGSIIMDFWTRSFVLIWCRFLDFVRMTRLCIILLSQWIHVFKIYTQAFA